MHLKLRERVLSLDSPQVMGVLNVTPDSFSDGGRYALHDQALRRAAEMVDEGAAIIDVGGESTRPGAAVVAVNEEIDRVVPVIAAICRELDVVVSVDTMKPEVMRAACAAGAEMINDVLALQAPGAIEAARDCAAAVCLMHMQGTPQTMQQAPHYDDVLSEVAAFLQRRIEACVDGGIERERICIDPGIGFGKQLPHNLRLLGRLDVLNALDCPLLLGVSRKSLFAQLLGRPVTERLPASLAAAAVAVWQGAAIVRAHDVRASVDAVRVVQALLQARGQG